MKNMEFFRNVSIGQYVDEDTPVHRLAPATKYLWLLALLTPASLARSTLSVMVLAASSLVFALVARVRPLFLLRGFLPVMPILLIAAVLQVAFTRPGDNSLVLIALGPLSLSALEARAVLGMAARFVTMMLSLGLFTSVITEGDTARG
ncbi:MAG: hypothetical protein E4H20_11340, partial [Spirochaetales bacterium]